MRTKCSVSIGFPIAATFILATCGSSSEPENNYQYGDRCAAACDLTSKDTLCATSDNDACTNACGAQTEGLTALCATCIAEHTGMRYEGCSVGSPCAEPCEWHVGTVSGDCTTECAP